MIIETIEKKGVIRIRGDDSFTADIIGSAEINKLEELVLSNKLCQKVKSQIGISDNMNKVYLIPAYRSTVIIVNENVKNEYIERLNKNVPSNGVGKKLLRFLISGIGESKIEDGKIKLTPIVIEHLDFLQTNNDSDEYEVLVCADNKNQGYVGKRIVTQSVRLINPANAEENILI